MCAKPSWRLVLLSVRACRLLLTVGRPVVSLRLINLFSLLSPLARNLRGDCKVHENFQAVLIPRLSNLCDFGRFFYRAPPASAILLRPRQDVISLTGHPQRSTRLVFHIAKPLNTSHWADTAQYSCHSTRQVIHTSIITVVRSGKSCVLLHRKKRCCIPHDMPGERSGSRPPNIR